MVENPDFALFRPVLTGSRPLPEPAEPEPFFVGSLPDCIARMSEEADWTLVMTAGPSGWRKLGPAECSEVRRAFSVWSESEAVEPG